MNFAFPNYIESLKKLKWFTIFGIVVLLTILAQSGIGSENSENAAAISSANEETALTEDQVVELALKNSRKIQSLGTNVAIANYRLKSSGRIRNPELRISDVSTRYYTEEFDELRAGLRLRFPQLGELGEEKQQASVDLWDRQVEETRYRQEFIARVRKEFADVLMYDQLNELARKRVAKADERIHIIEQLVDMGSRSIVYLTKAKMWQAESVNDLSRTQQSKALARRKLAKRTNTTEDIPVIMNELPEVTQDVDELIKLAISNRPEIELVQQRIELANMQKRLEYLKLIPWFNFVELTYHAEKKRHEDWGEIMMGINLPIFDWNFGNIKATHLATKKKADESDAITESIADEVRAAFIVYKDVLLDWKNFDASAQQLISNAATVVQQAQRYESLMADEVLEMEWTIFDMQKLLVEKRNFLAQALNDLYFALGIEGPEKLARYAD